MGLKPWEFWRLTFAEFMLMAEEYNKRQTDHAHELLYLAWHTEYFARCKTLPKFDDLLKGEMQPKNKPQSVDTMMAMAKILTVAFGGEIVETTGEPERSTDVERQDQD